MKYLAVLGRQPEISIAELKAFFPNVSISTGPVTTFSPARAGVGDPQVVSPVDVNRFGGVLKFAVQLEEKPIDDLKKLPEGKITIGVSDYSERASRKTARRRRASWSIRSATAAP